MWLLLPEPREIPHSRGVRVRTASDNFKIDIPVRCVVHFPTGLSRLLETGFRVRDEDAALSCVAPCLSPWPIKSHRDDPVILGINDFPVMYYQSGISRF